VLVGVSLNNFAPEAVKRVHIVIDNTSAYRMPQLFHWVCSERESEAIKEAHAVSLIANPIVHTIQMIGRH